MGGLHTTDRPAGLQHKAGCVAARARVEEGSMFMDVFKRWTAGLTTDSLEVDERRQPDDEFANRIAIHRPPKSLLWA